MRSIAHWIRRSATEARSPPVCVSHSLSLNPPTKGVGLWEFRRNERPLECHRRSRLY
jgi:hypothetical protein